MAGLNKRWWWTGGGTTPSGEYPLPDESGRLRVDGETFRHEDGSLFQWRGFSWFLGFLRYCRGEDVTPDLIWMRSMGVNIPRLFGPLPWKETPDYRIESFQFDKLDGFLSLLESYGLRSNWSLGHYRDPGLKAFVQRFYDIAGQHWSVVTEYVNEPTVGSEKPDPLGPDFQVNRRGILAAYGLNAKYYDKEPGLDPVLDFATLHVSRDSAWHRKARHCQEWQHECGKPVISDEPAKLTEPGFSYPGGKNDPNATPAEMTWHAGVCHLWTPGVTVHTEEGKWGRVPTPGMLQHTVCEAVLRDVWLKMDASIQTGSYVGAHFSTSPVEHVQDVWYYSSMHGNRAWTVGCDFSAPQPKPGWTVQDRWGPSGSLLTLTK